jgi:biopolymer transport protein ExbD
MRKHIQTVLFALLFAVSALSGTVDTGLVIHVDVVSVEKMSVEGKPATSTTLSALVASLVQDKDHTAVEISVPSNLDKAALEQIKNGCRKAGISLFSVVTKPASKS